MDTSSRALVAGTVRSTEGPVGRLRVPRGQGLSPGLQAIGRDPRIDSSLPWRRSKDTRLCSFQEEGGVGGLPGEEQPLCGQRAVHGQEAPRLPRLRGRGLCPQHPAGEPQNPKETRPLCWPFL